MSPLGLMATPVGGGGGVVVVVGVHCAETVARVARVARRAVPSMLVACEGEGVRVCGLWVSEEVLVVRARR